MMSSQICLVFMAFMGSSVSEKLFHSRDHSDVEMFSSHLAELVTDMDSAQHFLFKYGFMKPVNREHTQSPGVDTSTDSDIFLEDTVQDQTFFTHSEDTEHLPESPDFIGALLEFQQVSGLPVTGVFDDATKVAMNKPRCGVPDKEEDQIETIETSTTAEDLNESSEPFNITATPQSNNTDIDVAQNDTSDKAETEKQHHLQTLLRKSSRIKRSTNALWGHAAFSKNILTWRLIGEGYSSQLSVEEQRHIFRLAFRMWSEISPLQFIEDLHSPPDEIDIRLGFGTGRHFGCAQSFDGAGREFAHAWFLGDIHFDDDEHFTAPNAGNGISLLKVAVHEIGHVLGLPHIYRSGSIMQPSYRPQDDGFELDWLDRKAIQNLYGGCGGRFSTVFDWIRKERTAYGEVVVRFNTYFMRNGLYWLYENRSNRTRYGDPVSVQVGWHGLPSSGVDAYVHVWSRETDAAYFFKGAQYWRYDSQNDQVFSEDADGQRYPRLISEGFPGVPSPVDTAYYDRRDAHIYFFRGSLVYRFSIQANKLAATQKMTELFPALTPGDHPTSNLDAAYFSYSHNTLFLIKGASYWRVVGKRARKMKRSLPYNSLLPAREVQQQWFDICDVHTSALRTERR
ncbi:matrix metallopeptidase-21 isoform X1 [Tachysurus fulvidraco]|uniref:matrix metallopeptidase-21 isoform X1 n=2 Tax=Tachysurus fulvidraco TaxID=1234273 RepID=UPI000F4E0868|nr:matrix metallopeptidase-21 isoform X1 [Tachysurus fulvidraco]